MPDILGTLKTPRLATAPSAPVVGQQYYNTTDNTLYWWNGSAWIPAKDIPVAPFTLPARLSDPPTYVGAAPGQTGNGDLDLLHTNGWFYIAPTTLHIPPIGLNYNGYGYVHVMAYPGGLSTVQIVHAQEAVAPRTWIRRIGDTGGGPWTEIDRRPLDAVGPQAPGTDLNLIQASGWYFTTPTDTNIPTGVTSWGALMHISLSAPDSNRQVWYAHGSLDQWQRYQANGTWGSWYKIFPADPPTITDSMVPALSAGGRLGQVAAYITDWNAATAEGWYRGSGIPNQPVADGNWFMGEVTAHDTDWITQRAWQFTADTGSPIWERRKVGGTWQPWVQISSPDRLSPVAIQKTDCNACLDSGWYCLNGPTNSPVGVANNQGYLSVITWQANMYIEQTWYTLGTPEVYIRQMSGGAWGGWTKTYPVAAGAPAPTSAPTFPGSPVNGQVHMLRLGSSPYTFKQFTFDSTLGKWISDEEWQMPMPWSTQRTLSDIGSTPTECNSGDRIAWQPFREFQALGLIPQFRHQGWEGQVAGGAMITHFTVGTVMETLGVNTAENALTSQAATQVDLASGSFLYRDSNWRSVTGLAAGDRCITGMMGWRDSGGSLRDIGVKHIKIGLRWISP